MINNIQIFNLKLNPKSNMSQPQQKTMSYPADTFVRSSKPSFKGGYFDYVKVSKKYFRGQKPDLNTLEALKAEGVNTVINLTENVNDSLLRRMNELGMKHYNLQLDEDINPTKDQIKTFLNILNKPDTCAYAHCREGRNRTGIMTALYDVIVNERRFMGAYKDMLENRYDFKNHPNLGKFLESVCSDQKFLNEMGSAKQAEDPAAVEEIAKRLTSNPLYQKNSTY